MSAAAYSTPPPGDATVDLWLADAAATDRLATTLAPFLRPGLPVLLSGPVGAGKSAFARAAIRALTGPETEVPSPTFTLVQTYDLPDGGALWHADLYRLSYPDEVAELGLTSAFDTAICLVEWPDRLGRLAPPNAITLALSHAGDSRRARLTAPAAFRAAAQNALS